MPRHGSGRRHDRKAVHLQQSVDVWVAAAIGGLLIRHVAFHLGRGAVSASVLDDLEFVVRTQHGLEGRDERATQERIVGNDAEARRPVVIEFDWISIRIRHRTPAKR